MVAQNTSRTYGVNQAIRFAEGILFYFICAQLNLNYHLLNYHLVSTILNSIKSKLNE